MPLAAIEDAIADIRDGKFVIIVDDEDRENEGDLAIAAERITPDAVNYMATHARGLVCVPRKAGDWTSSGSTRWSTRTRQVSAPRSPSASMR